MNLIRLYAKRKRAISPVIAIVLMIGLAVVAVAAIFIVVLPLLQPTTNLQIDDAYIDYDTEFTKAADVGEGYGKGTFILSNTGTGDIEITSLSVYYCHNFTGPWTEITNHTRTDITKDSPYIVNTLTTLEELTVRFALPDDNDDRTISYRMVITTDDGATLDTTKELELDETNLQLEKDRPDISFSGTSIGYVRRQKSIRPSTINDNSEIKNVTYNVYSDSGLTSLIQTKTIIASTSLWQWSWNTVNTSSEGLDNGIYYMEMIVTDYAGLSASTYTISGTEIDLTIDNDYTPPTISSLWLTDPYPNNQTAEVGQKIDLTVEILDTGTVEAGVSKVDTAIVYYRLNGTVDTYSASIMTKYQTTNNWTTSIDSSFVDTNALDNGIECYVDAQDIDGNEANTSTNLKIIPVDDHIKPDIFHTRIQTANWNDLYINISATITDGDQVNDTNVNLYYRQTDDYGGITTQWNSISPIFSGDEYYWMIWSTDISIHGLDYFFNATDRFSGQVAYEGTQASPHHIDIADTVLPTIDHTPFISVTANVDLAVECVIFDNDPTFGAEGSETGTVTLYYRDNDDEIMGTLPPVSVAMTRISGNSSIDNNYETPSSTVWSATIPSAFINDDGNPSQLDYYIEAEDDSSNSARNGNPFHYIPVIAQGDPNIEFVSGSVRAEGTYGEQIYLEILNKAGSGTDAKVGKLNLTVLSSTVDFSTDYPKLNMTNINGSTVEWSNSNGVLNKTWITFSNNYTIAEGEAAGIVMTFENETNQPYSMFNLKLILELEVYNDAETVFLRKITNVNVPSGYISERLYMNENYALSTQGTTSFVTTQTPTDYGTNPTIQFGIRVYVGAYEITSTPVAIVTSLSSWSEQQGTWTPPQTFLSPTDSITISVRCMIDSNEYTMADFTTGPLGAVELKGNEVWTVNYWVDYWYTSSGPDRARGYFRFGDIYSYDSFVDNFTYRPSW